MMISNRHLPTATGAVLLALMLATIGSAPVHAQALSDGAFQLVQSGSVGGRAGRGRKDLSGGGKSRRTPSRRNGNNVACHTVSPRAGWQTFRFAKPVSRITSISGRWIYWPGTFPAVGPGGQAGRRGALLMPAGHYNEGALLMRFPGGRISNPTGPRSLARAATSVQLRINDQDIFLGDNSGAMRVCFR
jgi:hypothetical protein